MKKTLSIATLLGIALAGAGLPAAAGSNPGLPAPGNLVCSFDGTSVFASWDPVLLAGKYSVDVVAQYDTNGDLAVDTSLDFDYGTTATSITFPLTDLANDFGSGPIAPSVVTLRVKGLNPPGKRSHSQNNPFSGTCQPVPAP